jgi:hypothetical protein
LLAWGRLGSISAPFGEPASRFTSAIERSGKYGREDSRLGHSLVRLKDPSMYIRMRVLPVTLLLAWGRLGSISAGEPASRFTSAIERSGIWKKVR